MLRLKRMVSSFGPFSLFGRLKWELLLRGLDVDDEVHGKGTFEEEDGMALSPFGRWSL